MDRRRLLILSAALAAAPGVALADVTRTPLAKAFPFLDAYLGLPAAERSRFYLAYRATRDKRPAPGAQAAVVAPNGTRMPLPLDRTGVVTALPTLVLLRSGAVLESADPALKLMLEARAALPLSTRIDVGQLSLAMAQLNAAIAKIAGAMSFAAPKFDCAYFADSGAGQAVTADGHGAALPIYQAPILGPVPYFVQGRPAGAQAVVLARAPTRILLDPRPKGV